MTTHAERAADALRGSLARLDIYGVCEVDDDRVHIDRELIAAMTRRLVYVQGGSRVPFVRALISRPDADGIRLSSDEAHHLGRALDDIAAEGNLGTLTDTGLLSVVAGF